MVYFCNCALTGGVPTNWLTGLPSLEHLFIARNQLTGPIGLLSNIATLTTVDLSHNSFVVDSGVVGPSGFAAQYIGNNVVYFNGAYNLFGVSASSVSTFFTGLTKLCYLIMSHNKLTGCLPMDQCTKSYSFKTFDFSYNQFTCSVPTCTPAPGFQSLLYDNNPNLLMPSLPSWVGANENATRRLDPSGSFSCPALQIESGGEFTINPSLYSHMCRCQDGYKGTPPNCVKIPTSVTLTTNSGSFGDADFGEQRQLDGFRTDFQVIAPNDTKVLTLTISLSLDATGQVTVYDSLTKDVSIMSININNAQPSVVVQVLNKEAVVSVSSLSRSASIINATYVSNTECPSGYSVPTGKTRCVATITESTFAYSTALVVLVYVLAIVLMLCMIATIALLVLFRNEVLIRASSFRLLATHAFGDILIAIATILFAVQPTSTSICQGRAWLLEIGCVFVFGSLLAKAYRLARIFKPKKFKRTEIRDRDLFKFVGFVLGIVVLVLIITQAGDLDRINADVITSTPDSTHREFRHVCSSAPIATNFAIVLLCVLLVLTTLYTWNTHDIGGMFGEAFHAWIGCCFAMSGIAIALPLTIVTTESLPSIQIVFRSIIPLVIITVKSLAIFLPKFYGVIVVKYTSEDHQRDVDKWDKHSTSNDSNGNNTHTVTSATGAKTSKLRATPGIAQKPVSCKISSIESRCRSNREEELSHTDGRAHQQEPVGSQSRA